MRAVLTQTAQDDGIGVGEIGKGPEAGTGLSGDALGHEIGFMHRLAVRLQRGKGEARGDQGRAEIDPRACARSFAARGDAEDEDRAALWQCGRVMALRLQIAGQCDEHGKRRFAAISADAPSVCETGAAQTGLHAVEAIGRARIGPAVAGEILRLRRNREPA
jgi:hypothetical protein